MSQAPVQLIVAAFNDEHEADQALKELKRAKKEKLIGIQAAAVLRRDQKNKMHIKEVGELTGGKGAVGGAILGVALGIITGGAGLLLGAVGALVGGIVGKAHDTGFDNQRLKTIGESLKPGSSAIVAVIEHRWVEDLENELQAMAFGRGLCEACRRHHQKERRTDHQPGDEPIGCTHSGCEEDEEKG